MKSTITITKTEQQVYKVDRFICEQTLVNDNLTSQRWTTPNTKESHPYTYKSNKLYFHYYEDLSFLDSEVCTNTQEWWKIIPEPQFVPMEEIEQFNQWYHLLLDHTSMDGFVYQIDSRYPISLWQSQSYIGGICNDRFNLSVAYNILKNSGWARDIEMIDIPYYNVTDDCDKAIEFKFKLPQYILNDLIDHGIAFHDLFHTWEMDKFDPFGLKAARLHD